VEGSGAEDCLALPPIQASMRRACEFIACRRQGQPADPRSLTAIDLLL
jgi:hypothetical protein